MRKIENIAIVFFPINDVGGIITWNREIQRGLNRLGVNTMLFYATPANTYKCDPDKDVLKERYTQLKGHHLSYNAKYLKESLDVLNWFDAVIFAKSSPHPTAENMKYKDIHNWQALYREVTVPKVVVFHDMMWEKTNPWSAEVAPYIDLCIGAQKKFMASVERYPAKCEKYFDFFPMDFAPIDALNLGKKQERGMVATQWIKWKNHSKLLPLLPKINIPIDIYGAGIEWHYLKHTEEYTNAIGQDFFWTSKIFKRPLEDWDGDEIGDLIVHNENSPHVMYGTVRYEHLQEAYASHLFSLDLSTRGYTNYTHFEPLAYRTISFIERRVADDPDNIIPDGCYFTYDLDELPRQLSWISGKMNDPILKKTLDNGQRFIRQADCALVAQRLLIKIQKL